MMDVLTNELHRSFNYFMELANRQEESDAYGLVADGTRTPDRASVACVGFGLSALPIGVERGFISYESAKKAALLTLRTFVKTIAHHHGFFVHFVDLHTGSTWKKSEYSTIDTALFLNGAICVDAYFDDPELHRLFTEIYERVDWNRYVFEKDAKTLFRMAYNPLPGGDYRGQSAESWIHQWNMYAEQLSMYVLAAGSDAVTTATARALYAGFERKQGAYKGPAYIYSPSNPLFVYQYSHAWVDFAHITTLDGIDWFENSRVATYANRDWCVDHQADYPTFGEHFWGITACQTPVGYRSQGVMPSDLPGHQGETEGVIPPSGAAGSVPFAPEIAVPALEAMLARFPQAFQKYGFVDGIKLCEDGSVWVCPDYIGINKGITLLMLDNYLAGTTWKLYQQHPLIKKAIAKLGFSER
ncbi:MAG: glucoamylase family protein [bacterium]